MQKYLETSCEAQLFIRGRLLDGQTTLINAAIEQNWSMIELLIKHGAEVNAVGTNGRTALMEAALFYRLENTRVLLEHGEDKNIRDGEKRLAIDFARDIFKNSQEVDKRIAVISSSHRRLDYIPEPYKNT